MASVDPDAAFDFDECARGDVGEVGAPLARWVETEFPFKPRPLNGEPEELEAAFEAGATVAVAETLTGDYHPIDGESTLQKHNCQLSIRSIEGEAWIQRDGRPRFLMNSRPFCSRFPSTLNPMERTRISPKTSSN